MIVSIIAGLLTGGMAEVGWLGVAAETGAMTAVEGLTYRAFYKYVAEGLVWGGGGFYEISKGNKLSGAMDIVFATLLPILHFRWGIITGFEQYTEKEMVDLGKIFAGKTKEELESVFNTLTKRQKEIFRRIQSVPMNKWEEGTKKLYEEAKINFKKLGVEPVEKLEETYLKLGNFLQKKWYLSLPASLVRDFQFLGLISELFQKFKVEDTPKGDEAVKEVITIISKAKTPEEKQKVLKELKNIIESNNDQNSVLNEISKKALSLNDIHNNDTTGDFNMNQLMQSKIKAKTNNQPKIDSTKQNY
jgi:hypothetical protein